MREITAPSFRDPMTERLAISAAKDKAGTAPPGSMEPADVASRAEMREAYASLKAIDAARNSNVEYNNDGEFFTCIVFPSKTHREAFLAATHARSAFDDDNDMQYVDGMALARRLNIELPPVLQRPKRSRLAKLFGANT